MARPKHPTEITINLNVGGELKLITEKPVGKAVKLTWAGLTLDPDVFWPEGETNVNMTDTQKSTITITGGLDAEGNPATIEGTAIWKIENPVTPPILIIEPSTDGKQCVVRTPSPGPLGSGVVRVTIGQATQTFAYDIVGGTAVTIEATQGAPEEDMPMP